MYRQLPHSDADRQKFVEFARENKIPILHVIRKNLVATLVSLEEAKASGLYLAPR
jgi:hypothetical protein